MRTNQTRLKRVVGIGLVWMLGISMSACSSTSWKEEVLLHDGSKIIAKRSQSYGGRRELGQPGPIKEHTLSFTLPGSDKPITWTSEYSEDVGRANFNLLALHVLNGTPYVVASPNLCLSYNKWGRPNPPYVFFKYDGKEWQRIPLAEFPAEFKTANVDFGMPWDIRDREVKFDKGDLLAAETIKRHNEKSSQPEYRTILRELPVTRIRELNQWCGEMVYDGKGGWIGIGWFRKQPSYEACLKYCEQEKMSAQYCPCATLFKGK